MVVEFKTDAPVAVEQYVDLLIRSGLGQRRPIDDRACIEGMVRNASLLVTAWDGDHLIGAARSLTDFRYACFLSDLAVDRAYQRRGIGRRLLELTRQVLGPRCKIRLISAPLATAYYAMLGFVRNERCWELLPQGASTDA
ncbi:MAG: GNAT family N-acetyltransferase [Xanthomonadaceae bacterium]|nr:GNAT family N-acetyltransferase [Xanthomonadaceae bacterium]